MARDYIVRRSGDIVDSAGNRIMARRRMDPIGFIRTTRNG